MADREGHIDRKRSPLGDSREGKRVRCESCGGTTLNINRRCDDCMNKEEGIGD